jgi:hypothetical protein
MNHALRFITVKQYNKRGVACQENLTTLKNYSLIIY